MNNLKGPTRPGCEWGAQNGVGTKFSRIIKTLPCSPPSLMNYYAPTCISSPVYIYAAPSKNSPSLSSASAPLRRTGGNSSLLTGSSTGANDFPSWSPHKSNTCDRSRFHRISAIRQVPHNRKLHFINSTQRTSK